MRGIKKFKYKRVKVTWQDILNDNSWFDSFDDVDKMTYAWCQDTGYLYSKDEKMLKIFTSYSYDGDKLTIGNVTVFPRSVVKKIEVLKMTYEGLFDEVECKHELKRAKKFIEKQANIILALEKELEEKENEIIIIKNK